MNCPFLTGYERDDETGLDFAQARFYGSRQGRFVSPDPYIIIFELKSASDDQELAGMLFEYLGQPQNWAKYNYALNNPLKHNDPTGMRAANKFEQMALDRLDQLAAQATNDGDGDLAKALLAAKDAISAVISSLGEKQTSVGVNVAVNAILNVGNSRFATASTVTIKGRGFNVIIGGGQNKCNVLVCATHAEGAGLGLRKNGKKGRGYPLTDGVPPAANYLGDSQDRKSLTNLGIVADGSLNVGDIVAWRATGGATSGHSSIHVGGNVLVYAGSGRLGGAPIVNTLERTNSSLTGLFGGHEPYVVRRYNGKP